MDNQLTTQQMEKAQSLFGDRVRFDAIERIVYSHDMGVIPEQLRNLIDHTPDGVVQPTTIEEVVSLAKFCYEEKIPIVPRGAASAAYGGSVPAKAGIVVDFTRMNKILNIDAGNQVAVVQPGVIWINLENVLGEKGFALRVYPSSSKSSTVGGWVAQGGSGYGSYEYGDFRQNISAVTAVLPNGKIEIVGSPNVNAGYRLVDNAKYPTIAADYERMFRVLKSLPCDIFLGAHGAYFGLDAKYARMKAGAADAFVDPQGCAAFITQKEQEFRSELAKQTAARSKGARVR